MLRTYIIFVCLLILPISVYGKTANIDLQTLTSICESYENSIADVNVDYNFEETNLGNGDVQSNAGKFVGSQKGSLIAAKPFDQLYRLSLTMLSFASDGKTHLQTHLIKASNGSVLKELQRSSTDGMLGVATSGIVANGHAMYEYGATPLAFTIFQ